MKKKKKSFLTEIRKGLNSYFILRTKLLKSRYVPEVPSIYL
jgi:hypothetical protein